MHSVVRDRSHHSSHHLLVHILILILNILRPALVQLHTRPVVVVVFVFELQFGIVILSHLAVPEDVVLLLVLGELSIVPLVLLLLNSNGCLWVLLILVSLIEMVEHIGSLVVPASLVV